jgi:transcriptional regulator with XRE-family HTH domain
VANQERSDQNDLSGFGARIKRAREEQGLTQRELSEILEKDHRIRLDSSAVTRIESGSREPRIREALAIADVLGFPLTYGGLLDDIGGEAQFASAEVRLKRQMMLARRRIISASAEVHIAFDGIFGDEEEREILGRRGVATAIEWAESVGKEMKTWFKPMNDEVGAPNHAHVTDPTHRRMLEIIVDAITFDLYWTDDDYFGANEENKRWYREDTIRRAKESLIEAYGETEFQRRFGDSFDEPDA